MENLYSYGFWFNTYENLWYAIPRSQWTLFFSGKEDKHEVEGVYRSSEIDTLIQVICNPSLLESLNTEAEEEWEEIVEGLDVQDEGNDFTWPSINSHDNDDLPID